MASLDDEFDQLPGTVKVVPGKVATISAQSNPVDVAVGAPTLDSEFDTLGVPPPKAAAQGPKHSLPESVAVGFGNGATLGLGPRVIAAKDAANQALGYKRSSPEDPGAIDFSHLGHSLTHPLDAFHEFSNSYDQHLAHNRQVLAENAQEHPVGTLFGNTLSGVGIGGNSALKAMGMGAASALGGTDADLGKAVTGDTGELKKVATQTALSSLMAGLGYKAPITTGLATTGAALFAPGLSDSDRVQMGLAGALGAGLGIGGRVKTGFNNAADRATEAALVKPREQLQTLQDEADNAMAAHRKFVQKKTDAVYNIAGGATQEANKQYRDQVQALSKNQQQQQKIGDQLENLDLQQKALTRKGYDQREGDANSKYQEALAKIIDEAKAKTIQKTQQSKAQQALDALTEEEQGIPAQKAGKFASESGAVIHRIVNGRAFTGKDLPPELQPMAQRMAKIYEERTPEVIGKDPVVAADEYEAALRAQVAKKRQALEQKLRGVNDPTLVTRKPPVDPEIQQAAHNIAKGLGLQVPEKPEHLDIKARLPLANETPPPPVDMNAERLTRVARNKARVQQQQAPFADTVSGRPGPPVAEDINKRAAYDIAVKLGLNPGRMSEFDPNNFLPLDKSIMDKQVNPKTEQLLAEMAPQGDQLMRRLDKAQQAHQQLQSSLADPKAYVLGQGKQAVKNTIANSLLSGPKGLLEGGPPLALARQAYNDPATRAYLLNAVKKAIVGDTGLAKKYMGFFGGVSEPVAITRALYAAQNDPELQKALEKTKSQ